ncbi:hypothetical protein QX776_03225 [Alteromonadaceae bacterium BrNp21-10]|nr:hypothetical protein [Alteromonadaceae bacterium BrNp21-10]
MNKQQLAEELFSARYAHSQLTQSHVQQGVVFNDIVQLILGVNNTNSSNTSKVMAAINQSLQLRRYYQQLLNEHQFAASQLQVAASTSTDYADRINQQFSLKFKRDKFSPNQVYVVLQIEHPAAHHHSRVISLHAVTDETATLVHFPMLDGGQSQLLMDDSNATFELLVSPNAQLILL